MASDEYIARARSLGLSYAEAFPERVAMDRAMWEAKEAALARRWLGVVVETAHPVGMEFFDNFVNTRTDAPVSREELEEARSRHRRSNEWVSRRYASRRRTYDSALTMGDIRSILGCLDPFILEDVLLLGVAVDVRCILEPALDGERPVPAARPSGGVLALVKAVKHPHRWRHAVDLCNSRIHDKDCDAIASKHSRHARERHAYDHVKMRAEVGGLITAYVDGKNGNLLECAVDSEYSKINARDADSRLKLESVAGILSALTSYADEAFMERVFVLGCAAVVRNLITCFEGIMARDVHDGHEYDDIKWFFSYCNAKNLELGLKTGETFRDELSIYYHLLSDVMHGLDNTSHNRFFRGEHFTERFSTIRWEVLNLLFIFLVKLPDSAPLRSCCLIRSLVRGAWGPDLCEL